MKAPDRIWLPLEMEWTRCGHCQNSGFEQSCYDHGFPDALEYIRKGAFPVERLKIESEKPRDAAEAALTAELRWVINEVLSLLEGDSDERIE